MDSLVVYSFMYSCLEVMVLFATETLIPAFIKQPCIT